MVDGNFPDFWDKYSPVLKKLSTFILSNHNIELVLNLKNGKNSINQSCPLLVLRLLEQQLWMIFLNIPTQ